MAQKGSTSSVHNRWTPEEVRALGVRTDLATSNSILGITRAPAYELLKRGQYPVPVLRAGHKYVVPVAGLLTALGLEEDRQLIA